MNAPDTVTLSRDEYNALLDRLEDAEDELTLKRFNEDVAARGWETVTRDCLPVALVERKLAGEHPLRIWREKRNLTGNRLAALSGVPQSYISDIETSKKPGSIVALTKLARALEIQIDDLVRPDG
jgi:DNA-binding XRE family transcriptional regulator